MHDFGTSGVILGDLGTFWGDLGVQNDSVWILGWTKYQKSLLSSSNQFVCVYSVYSVGAQFESPFADHLLRRAQQ